MTDEFTLHETVVNCLGGDDWVEDGVHHYEWENADKVMVYAVMKGNALVTTDGQVLRTEGEVFMA